MINIILILLSLSSPPKYEINYSYNDDSITGSYTAPENAKLISYAFTDGFGWEYLAGEISVLSNTFNIDLRNLTAASRIKIFVVDKELIFQNKYICIPAGLMNNSYASAEIKLKQNKILFSNYEWNIKSSSRKVGPGLNYFSSSSENVYVDEKGKLHLKVIKKDDQLYSTEISLTESLGYGEYSFKIENDFTSFEDDIVFGFFLWDDDDCLNDHKEVDIEFSKWGNPKSNFNLQYIVHPFSDSSSSRFYLNTTGNTLHKIIWIKDKIEFISLSLTDNKIIRTWQFNGKIPSPGNEKLKINLWAAGAKRIKSETEAIISDFSFIKH
jgi:hypothetical protein